MSNKKSDYEKDSEKYESEVVKVEVKLPLFKKKNKSVRITGLAMKIDNSNLTVRLKEILIDGGHCVEKDFK